MENYVNEIDGVFVVTPATNGGILDIDISKGLKDFLTMLMSQGKVNILLDMSNVSSVMSFTLVTFTNSLKQIREMEGDLKFFGLRGGVKVSFEETRLNRMIDILESQDEGIAAFK